MSSDFQFGYEEFYFFFFFFLYLTKIVILKMKSTHQYIGKKDLPENSGIFLDEVSLDQLNMHGNFKTGKSKDIGKVKAML